jgi:excisionase family DNA binding protein
MSDLLRVSQAAKVLGVHPQTLRQWANEGVIAEVRTAGGHRRFERSAVEALRDGRAAA